MSEIKNEMKLEMKQSIVLEYNSIPSPNYITLVITDPDGMVVRMRVTLSSLRDISDKIDKTLRAVDDLI